ncbi:hypothetical protein EJB05_27385 [Eragrostis curvula]|uniref:Uncharacterized protein n=1 Tax=Eragrostis curvula TaxID=38414 RepID=A0A5J9UM92_9POAL|nr:hypothetical protein EJB05_27385 [Eragrostis curvula]
MISSDQEDSPAGRPLFDRTNIETAGEHDGELLAKKREEGRERTRLCRERKKAAKQKTRIHQGSMRIHCLPSGAQIKENGLGFAVRGRRLLSKNENNLPGGKENQPSDMQPNQVSRKHGFGDVIYLEIASDEFQNEATSRANKRDPSLNNGEPSPLSAVTNLTAHKNQGDCTLFR